MNIRVIANLILLLSLIVPVKLAWAVESHAVVLMYHRFGENKYPSTNIKTEQFIQQLDFFESNGFTVWPLEKIISHLKNKSPIPDKTIAITIDDAYLSVYQIAYPLMLDRNIPFTLFVSSSVVDKAYSSYMDWDQIKDMADHGVTIGNHSAKHLHLVENKQAVRSEVVIAQKRIKEKTNVDTTLFAYPYGEYDVEMTRELRSLDYIAFGQHSGPIGEASNFQALPRFPVSEHYSDLNALKDKLSSLPMPVIDRKPKKIVTFVPMPLMMITLDRKVKLKNSLQCFVSGQGRANVRWVDENRFTVQAKKPIVLRRSRYNCTIKDANSGRFFWYSHMWLRPQIPESSH